MGICNGSRHRNNSFRLFRNGGKVLLGEIWIVAERQPLGYVKALIGSFRMRMFVLPFVLPIGLLRSSHNGQGKDEPFPGVRSSLHLCCSILQEWQTLLTPIELFSICSGSR